LKSSRRYLWLLAGSWLAGQGLWAQGLHYGAMAGVNVADLKWQPEPYIYPEPRLGLSAGGFASIELDPRIQLRAELAYAQKGGSATYTRIYSDSSSGLDVRSDYETRAEMSYMEFPLLLSYLIKREENQLGSLNIGAYGAWLLEAEAGTSVISSFAGLASRFEYRLNRDDFRSLDFGLMAGISFYFYNFDLNFRYSVGLRKAMDDPQGEVTRFLNPTNRVLSLSLGYQLR